MTFSPSDFHYSSLYAIIVSFLAARNHPLVVRQSVALIKIGECMYRELFKRTLATYIRRSCFTVKVLA